MHVVCLVASHWCAMSSCAAPQSMQHMPSHAMPCRALPWHPVPLPCCSYYTVASLSLLPAAWYKEQQWQQVQPTSPVAAAKLLEQHLSAVPAALTREQLLVSLYVYYTNPQCIPLIFIQTTTPITYPHIPVTGYSCPLAAATA